MQIPGVGCLGFRPERGSGSGFLFDVKGCNSPAQDDDKCFLPLSKRLQISSQSILTKQLCCFTLTHKLRACCKCRMSLRATTWTAKYKRPPRQPMASNYCKCELGGPICFYFGTKAASVIPFHSGLLKPQSLTARSRAFSGRFLRVHNT
jgi:hypothetical protein